MRDVLLTSKITIPQLQRNPLIRQRLINFLNDGLKQRLVLISAPAGFGKTTLVSTWIRQVDLKVAWITLDEGDNDPFVFLRYLDAACRQVGTDFPAFELGLFRSDQDIFNHLTIVIDQISQLKQNCIIVLDDYHWITSQTVQDAVGFLIQYQPGNLQLVIMSRADPLLPLSRLRIRNQLFEIRLADLRFSNQEAVAFLEQVMDLSLSPAAVSALVDRTEGWVAGLQMAALSLKGISSFNGLPDPDNLISNFSGSNRYIMDYLIEEVLQKLSFEVRDFLVKTSILEKMNGPLCEAVLQNLKPGAGQEMLDLLEHNNLFIYPLDDHRNWYRYHRLFSDLLIRQLSSFMSTEVENLHRLAFQWYESEGYCHEAIYHALKACDYVNAGRLIESQAESSLMQSQAVTLLQWIEALPIEQLQLRPLLHVFYAWSLLYCGRPIEEINHCVQELQQGISLNPIYLDPLRAYLLALEGQFSQAIELVQQAVVELPVTENFHRTVATWVANFNLIYSTDHQKVVQGLEQVVQISQRAGNILVAVMTLCSLGDHILSQGNMNMAKTTYQRAIDLASNSQGNPLPVSGLALTRYAEVLREQNELIRAENMFSEGINRLRKWNEISSIQGYVLLSLTQQALGKTDEANNTLQVARQLAVRFDSSTMDDQLVELYQVRLWLIQGQLDRVQNWLENLQPLLEPVERTYKMRVYEHELISRSWALICLGRAKEAYPLLKSIIRPLKQDGRKRRLTEVLALVAMAEDSLGLKNQAIKTIERALSIAQDEGYIRVLIDKGDRMRQLLVDACKQGINISYARFLLPAFSYSGTDNSYAEKLPESLSDREIEVLNLISVGLTNQEIADRLFITVRTVKFHIGNIIGKLAVKNRTQAVSRARECGIL